MKSMTLSNSIIKNFTKFGNKLNFNTFIKITPYAFSNKFKISQNLKFFSNSNNINNNNSNSNPTSTSSQNQQAEPANQGGHCGKEHCGCHPPQEDNIEKELKAKNYKIIECINLGKYDEALDLSDEFINMVKSNFGDEHPFYLSALNNKAFILKTCGEYEEAIPIFSEVVDKYKKLLGENNEKVIITLHNLATVYKESKQFENSLEIYEKILNLINKQHIKIEGEQTGKLRLNIIANVYNSAGGLYRQLKNYKEADKLFALAYTIIKENFGENTLPIATVLNNMGLSLKDQGKFEQAMELYEKVLEIRKKLLDENHPEITLIKHNIEQLKNEMNNK